MLMHLKGRLWMNVHFSSVTSYNIHCILNDACLSVIKNNCRNKKLNEKAFEIFCLVYTVSRPPWLNTKRFQFDLNKIALILYVFRRLQAV